CRCRHLCRKTRMGSPDRGDHGHLAVNQVGSQRRQSIVLKLRPAKFDCQIAAVDITGFVQSLGKRIAHILCLARRSGAEITNRPQRWLLRADRDRPSRRAAEQGDELAPPDHSITSSARASSVAGTSRLSALAVLRLMTSSYLVGACTGRL